MLTGLLSTYVLRKYNFVYKMIKLMYAQIKDIIDTRVYDLLSIQSRLLCLCKNISKQH